MSSSEFTDDEDVRNRGGFESSDLAELSGIEDVEPAEVGGGADAPEFPPGPLDTGLLGALVPTDHNLEARGLSRFESRRQQAEFFNEVRIALGQPRRPRGLAMPRTGYGSEQPGPVFRASNVLSGLQIEADEAQLRAQLTPEQVLDAYPNIGPFLNRQADPHPNYEERLDERPPAPLYEDAPDFFEYDFPLQYSRSNLPFHFPLDRMDDEGFSTGNQNGRPAMAKRRFHIDFDTTAGALGMDYYRQRARGLQADRRPSNFPVPITGADNANTLSPEGRAWVEDYHRRLNDDHDLNGVIEAQQILSTGGRFLESGENISEMFEEAERLINYTGNPFFAPVFRYRPAKFTPVQQRFGMNINTLYQARAEDSKGRSFQRPMGDADEPLIDEGALVQALMEEYAENEGDNTGEKPYEVEQEEERLIDFPGGIYNRTRLPQEIQDFADAMMEIERRHNARFHASRVVSRAMRRHDDRRIDPNGPGGASQEIQNYMNTLVERQEDRVGDDLGLPDDEEEVGFFKASTLAGSEEHGAREYRFKDLPYYKEYMDRLVAEGDLERVGEGYKRKDFKETAQSLEKYEGRQLNSIYEMGTGHLGNFKGAIIDTEGLMDWEESMRGFAKDAGGALEQMITSVERGIDRDQAYQGIYNMRRLLALERMNPNPFLTTARFGDDDPIARRPTGPEYIRRPVPSRLNDELDYNPDGTMRRDLPARELPEIRDAFTRDDGGEAQALFEMGLALGRDMPDNPEGEVAERSML